MHLAHTALSENSVAIETESHMQVYPYMLCLRH